MLRSRPAFLVLVAAAIAACTPPAYPGEEVGTFEVTGSLAENTCGALALPAVDPLTFSVELRERSGEAFWRRPERPLVSGSVAADGRYRFRHQSLIPLFAGDPDPDFGHPGCTLVQTELVEVRLDATAHGDASVADAGESDATFADADADAQIAEMVLTGTNTADLIPEPGSDCTPATVAGGGPFLALPCRVAYDLRGEPRSSF